jgi:hypothetical protein
MSDGKCTKKYPRALIREIQTGEDGYPLYRKMRPGDGGFITYINMQNREIEVDNRWIVPYNPVLSKMFEAHINVEWGHSVKSIKYICKYINKGSDQAVFQLQKTAPILDEVQSFLLGRYISTNEAVWRILGFFIQERYPTVVHLSVHLENVQRIYFTPGNLQQLQAAPHKTLTAFIHLCRQDAFAKTPLYCDVRRYYTWNASRKQFQRRKQGSMVEGHPGVWATQALGHIYTVHPSNSECFYLRMLLHVVRGTTSFTDLKTVNGVMCETFREACDRLGLLESDAHWDIALAEAVASQLPHRVRHLFAILLTTCAVSNPLQLLDKYQKDMSENILHTLKIQHPGLSLDFSENIYNLALHLLEDMCLSMSG